MPIHILRVRKAGTTALMKALRRYETPETFILHSHGKQMKDVPPGDGVIIVIREPIARYVSGFNTRLREGFPRRDNPWTPFESKLFPELPTPNALGEALYREDVQGELAREAMKLVPHIGLPLGYWMDGWRDRERLYIGDASTLDDDFINIKRIIGVPPKVKLPSDPKKANRAPDGQDQTLSETAQANLEKWFADDLRLHAEAVAERGAINARIQESIPA